MPSKRELIAWLLVLLLATGVGYQYLGYSKALAKAEAAEQIANQALAGLKQVHEDRIKSDAVAQQQLAQANSTADRFAAILRAGSRVVPPQPPATPIVAPGLPVPSGGPSETCQPFLQVSGEPLQIGGYSVVTCGGASYVGAQASVDLVRAGGELTALHTQYDGAIKELAAARVTVSLLQDEAQGYKKAAKKSGIKRVLSVVAKVGLFVGGFYLGRHI